MYRLRPGDVVRAPLIGIDTATYESTRLYVAGASHLLDVRASRIATLEHAQLLADSMNQAQAAELRQCRGEVVASASDYEKMRAAATAGLAVRPRPPWLLDSHTYKGVGAGAAALVLLKLFVFHN